VERQIFHTGQIYRSNRTKNIYQMTQTLVVPGPRSCLMIVISTNPKSNYKIGETQYITTRHFQKVNTL